VFLINISKVLLLKEIKFTDIILKDWTCDYHISKHWQVLPNIFIANVNMDIYDDMYKCIFWNNVDFARKECKAFILKLLPEFKPSQGL
jgi:hypothetical protein